MTRSLLLIYLAVFSIGVAPAAAAPDRAVNLAATGATATWTSSYNVGITPTPEIAKAIDCDIRMCDETLVKTNEYGKLFIGLLGNGATLVDLDLYVYRSDEDGTVGPELGRVTEFDADETIDLSRQDPGYFLIRGDWSTGAGSFDGRVRFSPQLRP